jgi:16S rRNA (guanine966-N2)-methyltransferase
LSPAAVRPQPPHEVRIIGGHWRRSKLPVAKHPGLRPTPDRVRETLFNWLGQDLSGWRCLDAFAGTGALGLEAASRGAEHVVLLESEREVCTALRATHERLARSPASPTARVHIEQAKALTWMPRQPTASFELVFLDPPFDAQIFETAMQAASRLLVPHGLVYLESDRDWADDAFNAHGLNLFKKGKAGVVWFGLWQKE